MKTENFTELELSIIKANDDYREGNPQITDEEYDNLLSILKRKQPDSELLKKGVLEEVKEERKQELPIPMYSLNKVKSTKELLKWIESKGGHQLDTLIITPKYDGISLVVDEASDSCWTRGDGEMGQRYSSPINVKWK